MPVTLKEIAQKANVTPRVVSAVVNNDFSRIRVGKVKRERIRHLIEELHYTPNQLARSLVTKETRIINLPVPRTMFFEVSFNNRFTTGLQTYLQKHDYHLQFTNLEVGFITDPADLPQPNADAIILFWYGGRLNHGYVQAYRKFGLPVLTVRGKCDVPDIPNLYVDQRQATYQLTRELIRRGHTRITHVSSYGSDIHHQEGASGIRQAVEEAGIDTFTVVEPHFDTSSPDSAGRAAQIGRNGLTLALDRPERPTALIFNHDLAALAAIDMARTLGLDVPRDLSICGQGNDPVGRVFQNPSLTTTEGKARQSGARAGELILRMIKDRTFIPREKVKIGPIIRKSVRSL